MGNRTREIGGSVPTGTPAGAEPDLATRLPGMMAAAVGHYLAFASPGKPFEDAKAYAAHSAACRAALQHLELLIKLSREIGDGSAAPAGGEDVRRLIRRAQAVLDDADNDR